VCLWHILAAVKRNGRSGSRRVRLAHIDQEVEELLAHMDLIREKLHSVRKRLGRR
jgi:hypothetical protein